ncbi:hypothetical protein D3C71_1877220 [compost metagenome]
MACGKAFFELVGMRAQHLGAHAAAARQPVQRVGDGRGIGRTIDLGAVAGRQDGGFNAIVLAAAAQGLAQTLQRRCYLVEGKRKTTPQIKRSRVVIDA